MSTTGERFRRFFLRYTYALRQEDILPDIPEGEIDAFNMAHGFVLGLKVSQSHPQYAHTLLEQLGEPWNQYHPVADLMPFTLPIDPTDAREAEKE